MRGENIMGNIRAGGAWKVINNELGTHIQGATVNRMAEYIRDNLEVNALFLKSDSESILFINCDLVGLISDFVADVREVIWKAIGIDEHSIIISCTHTHSGPSLLPTNYLKPIDEEYMEKLRGWLVELARDAVESARPARLSWGAGEARIGYNRRCCWSDGTHTMHGDTKRSDFSGLEGPEDPQHLTLFAEDMNGNLIAIVHNNTSHPTCFYGRDFYSADFPGESRKYLREALGEIPILFFNGAFGDINMEKLTAPRPRGEKAEQKMMRIAHLMAGETLRLLHESDFMDNIVLRHVYEDLRIPVRLPDSEKVAEATKVLELVDAGEEVGSWDMLTAHGTKLLYESFVDAPFDTIPVHVVRIGDIAFVTHPLELFCQFGLDIKRRSPIQHTGICGISDGYSGYCPTMSGIIGGGYSGEPIFWTRLIPEGGYRLVECAVKLLYHVWQ